MNPSQSAVSSALAAFGNIHNNGTAVAYSGTMPATPETALSGNTVLCTLTYAATAFGAPSWTSPNMHIAAAFTASGYAPSASGACTFIRAFESNGTTVTADYTVGMAWAQNTAIAVGQYCTNGGNSYIATGAGTTSASGSGPSGTGSSIADGTVTWSYVGAGQLFDFLLGNVNIQTGVDITPTQTVNMPAV